MKKTLSILLILMCISFFSIGSDNNDVKTHTLKNGMKIMILEDHSIPNANMFFFWKVGSRNEVPGITGLSHFFEHMMFNGAKKYGFKEFDVVMEAAGGNNNAYTSKNLTVYTDFFPTYAMETIFDLEADRIENLSFLPEVVESERGVVYNEYKTRRANSKSEVLSTEVWAAAYTAHPYQWSVIGHESDIKAWTKEDLEKYFKTYYSPNNCLLVISGHVNTDEVIKLAEEYLEKIPSHGEPPVVRTIEPKQNGERRIKVYDDITYPIISIAYHVPETKHEDYYALEILRSILSSGNSSRLKQNLVFNNTLANNVYASLPLAFDPTLFSIEATATSKENLQKLEDEIYNSINEIIEKGVTEKELQKIKNQKLMNFYYGMQTIYGKSNNLGNYELFFGDYKKLYEAPELYNKVTIEDVKRVAAKYFTEENRTVGIMVSKN